MILYFTDRQLNILGHASNKLPRGLVITEDLKDRGYRNRGRNF